MQSQGPEDCPPGIKNLPRPQPASGHEATCLHTQLELVCTSHRAGPRLPEDSGWPLVSGLGFSKASSISAFCKGDCPSISSHALFSASSTPKPSCCWEPHVLTNELPKAPTSCSSLSPAGETQATWRWDLVRVRNELTGKIFLPD